ncbi:MAG: DNA topoisomerase VI subunit B [Planctomycetaceae bacterium]|jgi:DNA topoisomerase-6 subunit B|nr:DNA topoisomerase VI subunit B [Planctomycetaceae bacterium]
MVSELSQEETVNIAPKRRASAESMSAAQKEISVSEFFAKNRHLLGFDNPRKALLTTVKEAVDNSLDACEEGGILPEIWVKIEATDKNHFRVSIQDNGPGIVKRQIPLIFGKLLYGSKFHRLRMSRGQQGIGISAAGMYGLLTTGKPIRVMSKISPKKPVHYYVIRMDTKANQPEILNGSGEGEDIPPNDEGRKIIVKQGLEWVEVDHGTRVTIELEAKYLRGRGSVDEYLEQTAISNPHATFHYHDPDDLAKDYPAAVSVLPPEPKEIKPHPYGIEFGRLLHMLHDTKETGLGRFLIESFSRVSPQVAKTLCTAAGLGVRTVPQKIVRTDVEKLFQAIQDTRIPLPSTDCIVPIGEPMLLQGLHQVVPGEFFVASTRPPAVYRGNPFQIEVGLAYGGVPPTHRVSREALEEFLSESDARTLRQFLTVTFDSIGPDAADKFIKAAHLRPRVSPGNLTEKEITSLHETLQTVSISEGQTMNVYRYANRVPLQFQAGACLITQTVTGMNWKSYGLAQSRGQLPRGPITLMVHVASVWVPFTSESKEAIAAYPEIQKELRLALQSVGRKLGIYLRRRERVKQEGERRNLFLRYLGEVAAAVSSINRGDRTQLYEQLLTVAKSRTAMADVQLGEDGKPVHEEEELDLGDNVLIIPREETMEK